MTRVVVLSVVFFTTSPTAKVDVKFCPESTNLFSTVDVVVPVSNGDASLDCLGVCEGTAVEDCAGICDGDN